MALAIAGDLCFNPLTDSLTNERGEQVRLDAPVGETLPGKGFTVDDNGYVAPAADGKDIEVSIAPDSKRLQKLAPFAAWDGKDLTDMPLLIKTQGKCTTDHISMAGPWLRFRGHLENISDNMLMGAVNAFNGKTNSVWNRLTGEYEAVSSVAKQYKAKGIPSIVVAEENYGEGSSREHAAMEPRFLNVRVILAKSFARIHETNLKKQGMLALTFTNKDDYNKIQEHDLLSVVGLDGFAPGKPLQVIVKHEDGTEDSFLASHTYNEMQIGWFKVGGALNTFKNNKKIMSKVYMQDGRLIVPDCVTVPFIEGDGVGAEITPVCQQIVNEAVKLAYSGKRSIEWKEVLAGGKAFEQTGEWLPEATMDAFREYLIGIKGPLTTPVGGGIRSLNVALRQTLDLYVCLRPVRWFRGVVSPVKEPEK